MRISNRWNDDKDVLRFVFVCQTDLRAIDRLGVVTLCVGYFVSTSRVGTPEADSCAFFFSLTVHDLATLPTGHVDCAPDVEARVLPAGVLFFLRELESQVVFNTFAGSPKPLAHRRLTLVPFFSPFFSCDSP